ncbi:hypothetical protein CVIRNUC_001902 [Coccomyxa viridis]|uniref:RRM domain-containing protein n=1 Tax=Coccomyxa viridis TaxID=1274662 RepID=A0AAV1HVX8_9CHLO|nr:hypothetical protein CVIRNUC_001902 [Coccomyxa viridis]
MAGLRPKANAFALSPPSPIPHDRLCPSLALDADIRDQTYAARCCLEGRRLDSTLSTDAAHIAPGACQAEVCSVAKMRDRNPRTSLLVRNLPTDIRQEELKDIFSDQGRVALRDAYLPRDYYTGRVRGFGFVEFIDERDAEDAERHFDGTVIGGRTITVVFSKQDRKTPREMAVEPGYGSRERSPGRGRRRRSPSPRRERSRTPVRRRTRSPRDRRRSPSPVKSKSREPSRSLSKSREPSASHSPA